MLSTVAKLLLSLRYRIRVTGLEQLDSKTGVLILPNHPAEVDPLIISTILWTRLRPRPVVLESFYHLPVIKGLMRFVRAIPMPDMAFHSGPFKKRRVDQALRDVIAALKGGESVLIYPSGRLSVHGPEVIGGASGVQSILKACPECPVALIKIRGLFGSIFSKAVTGGRTPDLFATLRQAALILLQNGIFFSPRRDVTIDIEVSPSNLPRTGEAKALNRYLEEWYNSPEHEKPVLVSHSVFNHKTPQLPDAANEESEDFELPPETETKVLLKLAHLAKVPREKLTVETRLNEDLGLDSLTIAELLLWLDQEFEVTDLDLGELVTVGSVLRAAAGKLGGGGHHPPFAVPRSWFDTNATAQQPKVPGGPSSIPEAFLIAAKQQPGVAALGDMRSGVLTWSRVVTGAIIVARRLQQIPGSHIGMLFPASAGGSVVTIGAMLAGKVPVFLNWTAGRRAIEHAIESTGVERVLTSKAFLDIVPTDLEFLDSRLMFTEDIIGGATLFEKLAAKRAASGPLDALIKEFKLKDIQPAAAAVVLFTSGSEALPKGVPLSHANLLSNIRGVLEAFHLRPDDVLLGFLPPFHSFGLTICTLLPLITGLRVAYHPNPNESRRIAKAIGLWGVTIAAGTPTFLRSILKAGDSSQFSRLRILVSGAEKAPQELFDIVNSLESKVSLLEGYGITECSPVVTVNRPDNRPSGVGRPLPEVELAIVHAETLIRQPEGEQGLILIRGKSIFSGYLGTNADPFIVFEENQWYNSGDLGILQEGALTITGRLKRFIKIGGEMVSLGAVEEALYPHAPSDDGAPTLAVVPVGTEGGARPQLILFTTSSLTTDRCNELLKEHGLPSLVRLNEVKRVAAIPVLGSGKTDYQSLKGMV